MPLLLCTRCSCHFCNRGVQGGPGPKGDGGRRYNLGDLFDYDFYQCRVVPNVLLKMIRKYYPRIDGEKVSYPPPITSEGGDFQYKFPAGAATPDRGGDLDNQKSPYSPGPPHWCTVDMYKSGHWDGVCPYVFKGPDAGQYRHPHIAFAALEVYLTHQAMPNKCATTWLENNPDFLDADRVATDTPFPEMDSDNQGITTLAYWIGHPRLPWNYISDPVRAHPGLVSTKIYFSEVSYPAVITAEFGFSQIEACGGDGVKVVWRGYHNIQETKELFQPKTGCSLSFSGM